MSNLAPGAYVQESNFPAFTSSTPATTVAVFIGAHPRGPLTPTLIQSWAQFVSIYGGFSATLVPSNLMLGVYSFFNNGGGQAYVIRVAHEDAVSAAAELNDSGGSPTLTVTALNPGVWADNIYVSVTAGVDSTHFNLLVFYGGTANSNIVERWNGLTMTQADPFYAVSIVNNVFNGSQYVNLGDLNGTPSAPGNMPALVTGAQLGNGSGSTPGNDGSAVVAQDLVATTTLLDAIDQPLTINLPAETDVTNVIAPMVNYVTAQRAFQDSVVIVDPPVGQSVAAAIAFGASLPTSSYAAYYYPWLVVSDPASSVSGANRIIAPGASVMGQFARTDSQYGVQQAAAGPFTSLNALATEVDVTGGQGTLSSTDIGNLTAAQVNVIRPLKGSGIVIWGARTLSNVQSTLYLNVRRLLIYIESNLRSQAQFAAFDVNGWVLWNQITMKFEQFLSQLWASGALAGTTQQQAFFVTCDASNNSSTSGTVNVQVGVACQDPAEFIIIQVGQWSGGSSVTETV